MRNSKRLESLFNLRAFFGAQFDSHDFLPLGNLVESLDAVQSNFIYAGQKKKKST